MDVVVAAPAAAPLSRRRRRPCRRSLVSPLSPPVRGCSVSRLRGHRSTPHCRGSRSPLPRAGKHRFVMANMTFMCGRINLNVSIFILPHFVGTVPWFDVQFHHVCIIGNGAFTHAKLGCSLLSDTCRETLHNDRCLLAAQRSAGKVDMK